MKKLLIVVSLLLIIPLVFGGFALDFVTNTKSGSLKVDAQDVVVDKDGMRLDESLADINEDLDLCLDGVENLSENGEVFDERLSATEKVVDSCVEDIEDLSGEVSNFEGRLSETEDTLGSCVEDIESLLANGESGSDNGFCLAKINLTDGLSGTIEMLNGSFEDVMSNPASLVLVLEDSLFFSYKGLNGEPKAAIYECSINTPSGQVVYRCTLFADGSCELIEYISSNSSPSSQVIIDVSELPATNINENSFYRIRTVDIYMGSLSLSELAASQGITLNFYVVETLPTEPESTSEGYLTVYVLESTGIGYVTSDGTTWLSCGEANSGLTDIGWTDVSAEKTAGNLYTVITGCKLYSFTSGVWSEYVSSTNVDDVESGVRFKVLERYIVDGTYTIENNCLYMPYTYKSLAGSPDGNACYYYKFSDGRLLQETYESDCDFLLRDDVKVSFDANNNRLVIVGYSEDADFAAIAQKFKGVIDVGYLMI